MTAAAVDDYATRLEKAEYADNTVAFELTTLVQILKWLAATGRLPADHRVRVKVTRSRETTTRCWQAAEVAAMLDVCRAAPHLAWVAAAIIGLSRTGLRVSELASLRWSDVDRAANVIRLTHEPRRAGARGRQTKSGRSRSFPIHADLRAVLDSARPGPDGLIFHGPRGGRLDPERLRDALVRDVLTPLAPRFSGPADKPGFLDGRLHAFRHFFCSVCASSGKVAERVVMAWLGHADSDMVSRYYHLHDAESQRQMAGLSFDGGVPVGQVADGRPAGV